MTTKPLVSIILSSYNHEKYIQEAIEGIVNQTYGFENMELIGIDDCSKDNTGKIFKELSEKYGFYFEQNIKNRGLVKNRNYAISLAKGKYICGCGSDDIYHPERIEKQVAFMEKNLQYPMAFGRVFLIRNGEITKSYEPKFKGGFIFDDLLLNNFHIPAPTYIFRKEIFDEVGLYNESLVVEDYYMNLKIAQKYPIGFIDDYLSYYRIHDTNVSRNISMIFENQLKTIELFKDSDIYPKALNKLYIRNFYYLSGYDRKRALKLIPKIYKNIFNKFIIKGFYQIIFNKKQKLYST